VREQRLYYEPLTAFVASQDLTDKEKVLPGTASLRVVNIMVCANVSL